MLLYSKHVDAMTVGVFVYYNNYSSKSLYTKIFWIMLKKYNV